MSSEQWEFWIDVGGTFTDCLARSPGGEIRRHKLLSTGATKGRVGSGTSSHVLLDAARCGDPADFWVGWELVLIGADGRERERSWVTAFDVAAGALELEGLWRAPPAGMAYELRCGLEAPVVAIRYLLGLPLGVAVPPVHLRLGTTRGTNALLTRTGAQTALVTTRGFGDVLEIGYQARPRLFDLTVRKPPLLTAAAVEVAERVTHDGAVRLKPDEATARQQLTMLRESGVESLAVCFLHADRYSEHEQVLEKVAREVGFREISVSHRVAPLPKFVARADTTVVDAYLNPVLRDYVARLREALPGSTLRILTSAGGLVAADQFYGKDSILSGPAGGVVGFSGVARAAGFERAIGFDMGGTSTDVSRFDGRFELEYETIKAGVRLVTPTLAIETVAAGGGSICWFDGVKLVVGPASAGADPGPACYGRGGPLTVTDTDLVLGRVVAERFPFPLDRGAAEAKLRALAAQLAAEATAPSEVKYSVEELAAGLLRIANANMAAAIRSVTVAKGADPAEYVLVAFGGAAGQHACAVARELGIRQVLNHSDAGVLSALGIGLAEVTRHRSCGIERELENEAVEFAARRLDALECEAAAEVRGEGASEIVATRSLDVSYRGTDSCLTIEWPEDGDFRNAFTTAHRQRYGYVHANRPLVIVAARVAVSGRGAAGSPRSERVETRRLAGQRTTSAVFDGVRCDVPLYERSKLAAGDRIDGPAIVTEDIATTVIETGWRAEVMTQGELLLTDGRDVGAGSSECGMRGSIRTPKSEIRNRAATPDPVLLEIFNNHLSSIASEMGVTLRNTASSVNVKERLDFSCAIFTAEGCLVANAPHVPVHLGAMEETVRATIAANSDLLPGDVIATNDPYAGGCHLPDVTVITPIHEGATGKLRFFTANRAHHAELGGITPGSMPPNSRNLAEEGVLLNNLKIVAGGKSRFDDLRHVLSLGPYPSRDVETNLADVAAQVAANRQGANELASLIARYSWPVVEQYMNFVQDAAERKVRQALAKLPAGAHEFVDYLETAGGESVPIAVKFTIHEPGEATAATLDFTGTGPVVSGNLNANRAIVTAAVIYVLRLLVDDDIPLNHGVLRAIEIVLPGCLLNPSRGATAETTPAVVGGNVETSQRVVDVLLGALGIAAASQGTMNNLVFGDAAFAYYETICGGSGATADGPGASAVQVHMTNTRLTDPEILERRYPVRLREFAVWRGSGGAGRQRGGDGVVREIEFLKPVTLSLLSERRGPHPPYGMRGGQPGTLGRNQLVKADGTVIDLGGIVQLDVAVGDTLRVETPGGGGFGK
ncbi:MAG: hydantoinase B/oxoprolinase family protein [Pirellulales bacterium]